MAGDKPRAAVTVLTELRRKQKLLKILAAGVERINELQALVDEREKQTKRQARLLTKLVHWVNVESEALNADDRMSEEEFLEMNRYLSFIAENHKKSVKAQGDF